MILGIDEVGRGPWAGPLVVGACILPAREDQDGKAIEAEKWQEKLTDSKKLSIKQREELYAEIKKHAVYLETGWVSAEEVSRVGLSEALRLATRRAVKKVKTSDFSEIIIDGTQNFLQGTSLENQVTTLKKADLLIKEVSAAAIFAKVERDHYMYKLVEKYPEYGFEKHVGYGTVAHKAALEKYGVTPEHRTSYRPVAEIMQKNTTEIGQKAEKVVAEFLMVKKTHKILARNYKTKYYEIDIVSATKDHVYFTEVKYRKTAVHGSGIEAIDQKKLTKMTLAAELFMRDLAKKLKRTSEEMPSPILAAAEVSGDDFSLDQWIELTD